MFILIGTVLKALHSFMSNNSSLSLLPQAQFIGAYTKNNSKKTIRKRCGTYLH